LKQQWQFRVRWKGYDEDENIWYSWYFKSGRSVTNLSTQGRSSAIYPIISSDIIGQITENKTDCSGSTTGTAGSTACEAKQDKDIVTVVIKRSSTFFLGQNNLFI